MKGNSLKEEEGACPFSLIRSVLWAAAPLTTSPATSAPHPQQPRGHSGPLQLSSPAHKPQINGFFSLLSSHSALQVLQPISREGSCQWQCQQHCRRFPREFVHSPALEGSRTSPDNALRNLSWTRGKKQQKNWIRNCFRSLSRWIFLWFHEKILQPQAGDEWSKGHPSTAKIPCSCSFISKLPLQSVIVATALPAPEYC